MGLFFMVGGGMGWGVVSWCLWDGHTDLVILNVYSDEFCWQPYLLYLLYAANISYVVALYSFESCSV